MARPCPLPSCLDYYRKLAKALLRAYVAGDPEARARFQRHYPRLAAINPLTVRLADAQLVVAREYGFSGWPLLQAHLRDRVERQAQAEALHDAAGPPAGDHRSGSLDTALEILEADPSLGMSDIYLAAVVGDGDVLSRFLRGDPSLARTPGGPRGWEALLYLCFSRFLRLAPERHAGFIEGARLLLKHGADPNAAWTATGDDGLERETALYGAAGVANDSDLTRLLLDAGADPNDGEVAYHSVEFSDGAALHAWWSYPISRVHRATALLHKLDYDDLEGVHWLLEHGADPNDPGLWGKTALHQALMRGRALPFFELLIQHGADVNARRDDGCSVYTLAEMAGREDVLDLIRHYGACDDLEVTTNVK